MRPLVNQQTYCNELLNEMNELLNEMNELN